MATPRQNDIIERAFAKHHMRNHNVSSINPELEELKESGIYQEARDSLMKSEDAEYITHIEKEARRLKLLDQKEYVDVTKHVNKQIWFDLEEIKRSNVLVSGMNQQGKTRLSCYLAYILRKNGFSVIVFDNSGVWKEISDIENYTLLSSVKDKFSLSRNHIIDMSLLRPSKQRKVVNESLEFLWLSHVNAAKKTWQIIVLEEAELYCQRVRGELSESIYRVMCVGANQGLRIILISPCMSVIDPLFIRLTGQRYHFKLAAEENSLRKFRRTYGGDNARIVKNLDVGYCLYYLNGKTRIVNVPLWEKRLKVETERIIAQ